MQSLQKLVLLWVTALVLTLPSLAIAATKSSSANPLGNLDKIAFIKPGDDLCRYAFYYNWNGDGNILLVRRADMSSHVPRTENPACQESIELTQNQQGNFYGTSDTLFMELELMAVEKESLKMRFGSDLLELTPAPWQLAHNFDGNHYDRMDSLPVALPNDYSNFYFIINFHRPSNTVFLQPNGVSIRKNPDALKSVHVSQMIVAVDACTVNRICTQRLVKYKNPANIPGNLVGADLKWLEVENVLPDGRVIVGIEVDGRIYSYIEDSQKLVDNHHILDQ